MHWQSCNQVGWRIVPGLSDTRTGAHFRKSIIEGVQNISLFLSKIHHRQPNHDGIENSLSLDGMDPVTAH